MHRWRWPIGPLVVGLLLLASGSARAERVPSYRTAIEPSSGARTDITVPYLTNGYSTLGVWQGVSPFMVKTPIVNNPAVNGVQPVTNLIFYGSRQGFSAGYNGATPRPPQTLRPGR